MKISTNTYLYLFALAYFLSLPMQPTRQTQPRPQLECKYFLDSVLHDDTIMAGLFDPQIVSQKQLDSEITRVKQIARCLESISPDAYTDEMRNLSALTRLFLLFTTEIGSSPGQVSTERIDLSESNDPAVVKLRDEIGISPPPGWIFVRRYPSRQEIPVILRDAFENPQVVGVTILSRYVAVLDEPRQSWVDRALQAQVLPQTISHELVHAYVNSSLAQNRPRSQLSFPRWFEEGLASYISFSDRTHVVISPNMTVSQTPTKEYLFFTTIFRYLSSRYGTDQLNKNIRSAVEAGDASLLYRDLGFPDDRWLEITVSEWQAKKMQKNYLVGIGGLVALFLSLYLALPEFECTCGYLGRRRDFAGGQCPDCGRTIQGARFGSSLQSSYSFFPNCQICGKRFWPWQHDQLSFYARLVRAWQESELNDQAPLAHYGHRICKSCRERSLTVVEKYRQTAKEQIAFIVSVNTPVYLAWLMAAPGFDFSGQLIEEISIEQATDQMLLAGLAPYYEDWLENQPAFDFLHKDQMTPPLNSILPPPDEYLKIIKNRQSGQSGSIFRGIRNTIIIYWD